MFRRMVAGSVAIFLAVGVAHGQERLTPEIANKVKRGLTEEEVLKLVPGTLLIELNSYSGGTRYLIWEEVRRIRVEFTEDKATLVTGTFSKAVDSKRVTVENLKKITLGMSRKAVENLLKLPPEGKGYFSSEGLPKDEQGRSRVLCEWWEGRRLKIGIKDGKVESKWYADSSGD